MLGGSASGLGEACYLRPPKRRKKKKKKRKKLLRSAPRLGMLSAAGASACGFRSPRFPSGRGGRPGVRLRARRASGAAVRGGLARVGRLGSVCQRGLAAEGRLHVAGVTFPSLTPWRPVGRSSVRQKGSLRSRRAQAAASRGQS